MRGPVTDARAYELREREPTVPRVADLFKVSDEAMHYRLHNLGLVEDMPRKA